LFALNIISIFFSNAILDIEMVDKGKTDDIEKVAEGQICSQGNAVRLF